MSLEEFKTISFLGTDITIGSKGTIIWNNTERNHYKNKDGYPVVSIKTAKGWRGLPIHRLIAEAFIPRPNNNTVLEVNHKDYNRENFSIDNLEWITHGDNVRYSVCNKPDVTGNKNPNYGNRKLSKIYAENPELAKEKQSRPGLQNGRCRKINVYKNNILYKTFDYIKACMLWLQSIDEAPCKRTKSYRCGISKSIKHKREYKGYTFEYID